VKAKTLVVATTRMGREVRAKKLCAGWREAGASRRREGTPRLVGMGVRRERESSLGGFVRPFAGSRLWGASSLAGEVPVEGVSPADVREGMEGATKGKRKSWAIGIAPRTRLRSRKPM
jgi:hypothetical protein